MQHNRTAYMINRQYMIDEDQYSGPQTFALAHEFLEKNHAQDNWLLQLECFDPHEPFHAPARFRERYPSLYKGPILDWPHYEKVQESPEEIAELRANYAALVTMCDEYFGRLLDFFDARDLWQDTCLILTTDHGFLLGEHDWWAKNRMPVYDEIAHIPLMIFHPEFASQGGTRRNALTQCIDMMPTILSLHGQESPPDVMGQSLIPLLEGDHEVREAAIFGLFGAACNVTDGSFVYHRYPESLSADELYEYTLMPTRMPSRVPISDLIDATLTDTFSFTKGAPVMRIKPETNRAGEAVGNQGQSYEDAATCLYDLSKDPQQVQPIDDPVVESRLVQQMIALMRQADAPTEMFKRFDF